jgi:hypothetical protein
MEPVTGGGSFGGIEHSEFSNRGVNWSFKSNNA